MHEYTAHLSWQRQPDEAFVDQRYSRRHHIAFDGGVVLAASSSPSVVPLPFSDATAVDPEEMFVAALSSCHALWFLSLAAEAGWRVDDYDDAASGVMGRFADTPRAQRHALAMTLVTLRPRVNFGGERQPTHEQVHALHEQAHERCFIANSVRSEVRCEPRF